MEYHWGTQGPAQDFMKDRGSLSGSMLKGKNFPACKSGSLCELSILVIASFFSKMNVLKISYYNILL